MLHAYWQWAANLLRTWYEMLPGAMLRSTGEQLLPRVLPNGFVRRTDALRVDRQLLFILLFYLLREWLLLLQRLPWQQWLLSQRLPSAIRKGARRRVPQARRAMDVQRGANFPTVRVLTQLTAEARTESGKFKKRSLV